MVSLVTAGVRVSVESFYLSERSDPENDRYLFGYRITISNESGRAVQLMRRHWVITDEQERVTEVRGEGVVGEQPVIEPGATHTYTSGSVMETPTGTMEGTYEMADPDGVFEVEIPLFVLAGPRTVH